MPRLTRFRDILGRFTRIVPQNLGPIELPVEAPDVNFGENYGTVQVYSKGFEFAFMSDIDGTYKQVCTFAFCKDFLHDVVWATVNKAKWEVYGFTYDPSKDVPLDLDNCVFALRNTLYKEKPEEFHKSREACQEFLNKIEEKLGFQPTRIYEVPHPDSPCWLIIGDKSWQHAPPMVGLYTLFIRLGLMHPQGGSADETLKLAKDGKIKISNNRDYAGNRDCSWIAQGWVGIQAILKHSLKIFHEKMEDNYPKKLAEVYPTLHDGYGPVNFSNKHPKEAMPHWYRDEHWK